MISFAMLAFGAEADSPCSAETCTSGTQLLQRDREVKKAGQEGGPAVEITNEWLTVNNHRYSRKRAHDAWLGRIGRNSGIWIAPILLNFRTTAPAEWLDQNVNISTVVTLSSEQYQNIAASVSGGFGGFKGDAGINSSSNHNASYVLRGLTLADTMRIKRWFNDAQNQEWVQDYMDMYDASHKPRFVTTVWVVDDMAPEHGSSCTGGHLSLGWGNVQGNVKVNVSGHACTHSSWTFSANTIVAYETSYLKMENMISIPPSGRVKDVPVDWYYTR